MNFISRSSNKEHATYHAPVTWTTYAHRIRPDITDFTQLHQIISLNTYGISISHDLHGQQKIQYFNKYQCLFMNFNAVNISNKSKFSKCCFLCNTGASPNSTKTTLKEVRPKHFAKYKICKFHLNKNGKKKLPLQSPFCHLKRKKTCTKSHSTPTSESAMPPTSGLQVLLKSSCPFSPALDFWKSSDLAGMVPVSFTCLPLRPLDGWSGL